MDRAILITGGAGFIGSRLVHYLSEIETAPITVLDDLSQGRREALTGLKIDLVVGDIRDTALLRELLPGHSHIVHLAANPSVLGSVEDPAGTHSVNYDGTVTLTQAAIEASCKRLIFASSSAVYGHQTGIPIAEDAPKRPLSPYGVQKLAAEGFLRGVAARGFDPVSLRFFNIYGPGQRAGGSYAAAIPAFQAACRGGGRPTIYGSGQQTRDFLHLDDLVELIALVLDAPGKWAGAAYNVGSGYSTSIEELARLVMAQSEVEGDPQYDASREGDIEHSVADISLIKTALATRGRPWIPRRELLEGLAALEAEAEAAFGP